MAGVAVDEVGHAKVEVLAGELLVAPGESVFPSPSKSFKLDFLIFNLLLLRTSFNVNRISKTAAYAFKSPSCHRNTEL